MFPCDKGVFWLLLAIVAEIPPVVSLTNFSVVDFLFIWNFIYQVFIFLDLNGISLLPSLCKTPSNPTFLWILASFGVVRF